tara:strand:+ start:189 stop:1061 length:873 start_codon:yes stop_codon:yes gene_type:complete
MQLGRITAVTITTPDLDKVIDIYSKYLGYRFISSTRVSAEQAKIWDAENIENSKMIFMSPESSNDFFFRFIEQDVDEDYVPFGTYGWNAAELIVKDVDRSAEKLIGSPFEVIGEPADLSFTDQIRAMQIMGPSREVIYLTQFKSKLDEFDSPSPRCDIDQTFIVILAGENLDDMQTFLNERLYIKKAEPMQSRIRAISKVFDLPEDTKYKSAALAIGDQSLIELDEMPSKAGPRAVRPGYLPSGISIVSFIAYDSSLIDKTYDSNIPSFEKARASTIKGSSGELIEIINV